MLSSGFVGEPPLRKDGRRAKGIYTDFVEAGGATPYDRTQVRADLRRVVGGARVVVLAWARCGFATKACGELDARGIAHRSVVLERYGAAHAELALLTGRPSVPYVYADGQLLGGCDADAELGGLEGWLEAQQQQQQLQVGVEVEEDEPQRSASETGTGGADAAYASPGWFVASRGGGAASSGPPGGSDAALSVAALERLLARLVEEGAAASVADGLRRAIDELRAALRAQAALEGGGVGGVGGGGGVVVVGGGGGGDLSSAALAAELQRRIVADDGGEDPSVPTPPPEAARRSAAEEADAGGADAGGPPEQRVTLGSLFGGVLKAAFEPTPEEAARQAAAEWRLAARQAATRVAEAQERALRVAEAARAAAEAGKLADFASAAAAVQSADTPDLRELQSAAERLATEARAEAAAAAEAVARAANAADAVYAMKARSSSAQQRLERIDVSADELAAAIGRAEASVERAAAGSARTTDLQMWSACLTKGRRVLEGLRAERGALLREMDSLISSEE